MKIDLRLWRDLPGPELRECEELLDAIPPQGEPDRDIAQRVTWAPTDPDATWVIRVWHEGRLVSFVALIVRIIAVDGIEMRAAGVRGLRTHPDFRRRGFGTAAMKRATDFVWERLEPDLALLLSSVMAVPFYEQLGWRSIKGRVFCEQAEGSVCYSDLIPEAPVMVLIPAGAEWPRGEIDLRGFPF